MVGDPFRPFDLKNGRSSGHCRSLSLGGISRLCPHVDLERSDHGTLSLDYSTKERLPRSLLFAKVISDLSTGRR